MYRYGDGTPFPFDDNVIELLPAVIDACVAMFGAAAHLDGLRAKAKDARRDADAEGAQLTGLEQALEAAVAPLQPALGKDASAVQEAAQRALDGAGQALAMGTNAIVTVQGGPDALPTILGQGPIRIPTAGKIRAGIKVLTRKAAQHPEARAIYDKGPADGLSFDEVERAITAAVPALTDPLVPRNVPWFTVREGDFANPELARQIMDAYGEDRGDGRHLYRFPVIIPSDHWPTVMPHELAAWGASDKRYWSQYSPDGKVRQCMRFAPVPVDDTGRRTVRIFGGRKVSRPMR